MTPRSSTVARTCFVAVVSLLMPVKAHAFSLARTCAGDGVGPGGLPETVSASATSENGTYTVTVKDCCCVQAEECNPAPDNPSSKCQKGTKATLSVAGIADDAGCPFFTCNLQDQTAEIQALFNGTCQPEIGAFFPRPTELPNGEDDDCDGFIDDEQCDDQDNDGDGLLNEDPGSCLLQVAAVPIGWQRPLSEFRSYAEAVFRNFLAQVGVLSCSDNFHLEILDDVILTAPTCPGHCGVSEVKQAFRNQYGNTRERDFDVVAAFVDHNICGDTAGCSDGAKFIWIEAANDDLLDEQKNEVFSHEVGHFLGLADEYCSKPAGSTDARCSPRTGAPNPLSAELGCNPNDGGGCCNNARIGKKCGDVNYGVCCEGNHAFNHSSAGGRSIMAYANAIRPRGYDKSSLDHITAPPAGQRPLTCTFAYSGAQPVLYADVDVTPSGNLTLNNAVMTVGRQAIGNPGTSGSMSIRVSTRAGMMFEDFFEADGQYTCPKSSDVDYSGIRWESENRGVIVPMPEGMDPAEPVKISLTMNGTVTSELCLTHASDGTLAEDTEQPTIDGCTAGSTTIAECSTAGGVSRSDAQLASLFSAVTAEDNCDPDVSVSNDAPDLFALGDTLVTFSARDADENVATCAQTVRVRDTTAPTITAPADLADVECTQGTPRGATPALGTPTIADRCDVAPTVTNDAPGVLPVGTTQVVWTATDASGESASDTQAVSVVDTTPPSIVCPAAVRAECTGAGVAAGVEVGAAVGSDLCGTVTVTNDSPGTFPLGSTVVTHKATDQQSLMTSCVQRVDVVDSTPPAITSISATPSQLWPPNHKMQTVRVAVEATDACDTSAPICSISAIRSSEPSDARGDGNTSGDWRIIGPFEAELRAERSGKGSGRLYGIEVTCVDAAGNQVRRTTTVSAPRSR